jgi:hypothetical protein
MVTVLDSEARVHVVLSEKFRSRSDPYISSYREIKAIEIEWKLLYPRNIHFVSVITLGIVLMTHIVSFS